VNFIQISSLLLFVVFSQTCVAQTDSTKSTKPDFIDYETLAEFPGGQDSLNWFIMKNLEYPKEALQNDISGIVYLMFVVDKNGYLNDVTVKKIKLYQHKKIKGAKGRKTLRLEKEEINSSNDYCLGTCAANLLANSPRWKPATQKGKYAVPLTYILRYILGSAADIIFLRIKLILSQCIFAKCTERHSH
jgi:hypothetical protein